MKKKVLFSILGVALSACLPLSPFLCVAAAQNLDILQVKDGI